MTRGGTAGTNPFNTHGLLLVDIKNGSFGGSSALENSDFESPADGAGVAVITNQGGNGTLYDVPLKLSGSFIEYQ